MTRWAVFPVALCLATAAAARADAFTVLPASRHHQFLTYGLFDEEQTLFFLRDGGNVLGGVGASMAFVELAEWATRPQIVVHGSVTASFRRNAHGLDLAAETFDGRFGFNVEMVLGPQLRLLVGLVHISGHVVDGVLDTGLIAPNLGDDALVARIVWDPGGRFRLGVSIRPLLGSDPIAQAFNADQFVEWFPLGSGEGTASAVPYLAAGLQEGGPAGVVVTWHAQAGVYFGSHVGAARHTTVRFTLGYYDGIDPRLKFARFRAARLKFPYAGIALNF